MFLRVMIAVLCLPATSAFALSSPAVAAARGQPATVTMGLFDGFAKAFENDDSLGARQNAGLSKEKQKRTVTWVGPKGQKKQALAVSGQQMKDIARASGIQIRYDCQEGTCKTCEAQLSPGGRTKLCVARMPNKDVTIKYNIRF
jgi:ferredoxin